MIIISSVGEGVHLVRKYVRGVSRVNTVVHKSSLRSSSNLTLELLIEEDMVNV